MTDLIKAKEILLSGEYSCALVKGESVYKSAEKGVKFLLSAVNEGYDLGGYSAADKVVGKAAALLMCHVGVKAVYAGLFSRAAQKIFDDNGIYYEYGGLTDNILNRAGSGICPMEKAVSGINDPDCAADAIRAAISALSKG